ncbi:ABC transporter permease [Acidothermaceae bacterium B102]|nr:ABC transporter permease [Acidothermaceae bacterium B102]
MTAATYEGTAAAPPAWRNLLRWETGLVVVLVAVLLYGQQSSANFFTTTNIFFIGLNMGEIAIMALPLTLIVIVGEIDLSVASMLGLSSTMMGYFYAHHWPIALCMLGVLAIGLAGGALNGWLVTGLGLPSIAVTIGTLALYRGLAEIFLKDQSVSWASVKLTHIGTKPVSGTELSWATLIFLVLALVYGVVLHATAVGRSMYAIGLQSEAARFAGIRVKRIKFQLFVLSGLVCSFAGILWTLRFATSRYDAGTGLELNVVAIVLFGGVSIFGGKGSIFGVLLAVVIFGCLQTALTLQNVDAQVQNVVTGGLLLLSVIIPSGAEAWRRLKTRLGTRT